LRRRIAKRRVGKEKDKKNTTQTLRRLMRVAMVKWPRSMIQAVSATMLMISLSLLG
jgi:hypothetical protein